MSRILVFIVVLAGFSAILFIGPPRQPSARADDKKQVAKVDGKKLAEPQSCLKALLGPLEFKGVNDPKATLAEVLDLLGKKTGVTFEVKEAAFTFEMIPEVLKTEVANPKALPPMKMPLCKVLKYILARIPAPSGATFLLREDVIEITTWQMVSAEINLSREKVPPEAAKAGALGTPLNPATGQPLNPLDDEKAGGGINQLRFNVGVVSISLDQQPLEEAIRQMRAQVNVSVAFDPNLGEKAKTPLTVTLLNSPLDSALRLMTEMLELDYVWLDNFFYVTSQEKAKKLRTTWPRRRSSGGGEIFIPSGAAARGM